MAKYQQYDEYKDSGVEWLGEIPNSWQTGSLRWMIDIASGESLSSNCEKEYSKENQFPVVGGNGVMGFSNKVNTADAAIAVGRVGALCGNIHSIDYDSWITDNALKISKWNKFSKDFLVYLLKTAHLNDLASKTAQPLITGEQVKSLKVVLLPIAEQKKIANFLDHETGQIDSLIEKQQTLIQLLKEKRQAVISHAVTKGLNSDAPMKDSGVEWLGEVPEHWNVGRVGYYGQVLNGSTPSKANLSYWYPKEIAWLSSGEVNQYYIESPTDYISYKALKECSVTLLPIGTLVMGMIGQGKTRGMSAVTKIETTINQNLAAVIPNDNLYSNYAHLFFQAAYKELREDARGGNQAALNCEIIRDFKITIPPINEQRTIFIEVNKISDKFDVLMEKAEQAIQLMQERRTALISAAVTGKIDVRGWVAPK